MGGIEQILPELSESIEILADLDKQYFTKRETEQLHGRVISAIQDAVELLKAQEPKVMTLEEVIKSEGEFWLEFREEDNDDYIRYGWAFFSGSTPDVVEIIAQDSYRPVNAFIAREYGERWRCWTSRPTDEQREAIPWND